MKNTTYVIKIAWCPDKIGAEDIADILSDKLGTYVEVVEE